MVSEKNIKRNKDMFFNMQPNKLCSDCWRYASFKEDCHFHWQGKRECSRYLEHENAEERFKTIIDSTFLF
jgi:hypothetical protein